MKGITTGCEILPYLMFEVLQDHCPFLTPGSLLPPDRLLSCILKTSFLRRQLRQTSQT